MVRFRYFFSALQKREIQRERGAEGKQTHAQEQPHAWMNMQKRLSLRPDHVVKKRVNYVTAKVYAQAALEDERESMLFFFVIKKI